MRLRGKPRSPFCFCSGGRVARHRSRHGRRYGLARVAIQAFPSFLRHSDFVILVIRITHIRGRFRKILKFFQNLALQFPDNDTDVVVFVDCQFD